MVRKKTTALLGSVILVLALSSCTEYWQYTNAKDLVFVNEDGNTYHTHSCVYKTDVSAEGILIDAVAAGFAACPVCSPPRLVLRADETLLKFVEFTSWIFTLGLVVAGPYVVYRIHLKKKAIEVARVKFPGDWESLSKDERKQIVRASRNTIDSQVSN